MKKILFSIITILLFGVVLFALEDVREVARDWAVNSVDIGTNNARAVYASPSANLSGRYRIKIENTHGIYDVSLGTFSSFTYASGWLLKSTPTASGLGFIDLPLPAGVTVYSLGQANALSSSVTVKVMEFK